MSDSSSNTSDSSILLKSYLSDTSDLNLDTYLTWNNSSVIYEF